MRIKILGKRYNLSFSSRGIAKGEDGFCDGPHIKDKRIRMRPSLRGLKLADTLLHETHHAADWHKDELWVHEVAEDQARILCRKEVLARFLDDAKLLEKVENILAKHGYFKE